ncbi:MAG TPA: hypothetical protein PLY09_01185 [Methanothrix sp.]|nr:hypothetical protein [Methanothrix sp.]HPJ83358.1 hypothetical protein [Methanothrix sp.]
MKRWIVLILLALVLGSGIASAHRMFVGQKINVETYAIFDDGTPANDASVKVYRESATTGLYDLYCEDKADSSGKYALSLPGKGTGNWLFEFSAGGHKEELSIAISDDRYNTSTAKAAALAMLPVTFLVWRGRRKR